MILVALDVDGTLDSSGGPVPWWAVLFLHTYSPPGLVRFGVVSPSKEWPGPWPDAEGRVRDPGIALHVAGPDRAANLAAFAAEYPWIEERYYVGDQETDRAAAERAGQPGPGGEAYPFVFVHAADWLRVFLRIVEAAAAVRGGSP